MNETQPSGAKRKLQDDEWYRADDEKRQPSVIRRYNLCDGTMESYAKATGIITREIRQELKLPVFKPVVDKAMNMGIGDTNQPPQFKSCFLFNSPNKECPSDKQHRAKSGFTLFHICVLCSKLFCWGQPHGIGNIYLNNHISYIDNLF